MKMAHLIVALDVPSVSDITPVIKRIGDSVTFYKVGLELFVAAGPACLQPLRDHQKQIFLDLKLHDIPRTVERAVRSAAQHHVNILTVHAGGGRAMLQAAAKAAHDAGPLAPKIVAVTTLTSLDQTDLNEMGVTRPIHEHTIALGCMAIEAGIDGLVCSPHEVATFRSKLGPDVILVTPGIRPAGADVGDQKRVATPASAIRDGSSHLVVGRPILEADNPAAAAAEIRRQMLDASNP